MLVTLLVFAALATQGLATPPSSTCGQEDNNFLFDVLTVAGYHKTCLATVLDYCDPGQKGKNFLAVLESLKDMKTELQAMKTEGQTMIQKEIQNMTGKLQDMKTELQAMKTEGQAMVQKEIQNMTGKLQDMKTELQAMKTEGQAMVQKEIQEVKTDVQQMKTEAEEGKGKLEQVMLMINRMFRPRHCKDLLDIGDNESGIRQVYPYPGRPDHSVTVYCEQKIDGGGWTVFQRRVNSTNRVDFFRNFTEYQAGFGDVDGEFWLGLDTLYELTKTDQHMRVDLADYEGGQRWAKYGTFRVGSPDTNYRLTIGEYSGDAGDSMDDHNNQEFSTRDADHDNWSSGNCADMCRGAWWYSNCHESNLNGYQYVADNSPHSEGITWFQWRGWEYSLMRTTMMLRPAL